MGGYIRAVWLGSILALFSASVVGQQESTEPESQAPASSAPVSRPMPAPPVGPDNDLIKPLLTIVLWAGVLYVLVMVVMKRGGSDQQRRYFEKAEAHLAKMEEKSDRTIELLESIEKKLDR